MIQSFNGFPLRSHNGCHWEGWLHLIRKGTVSFKRGFRPFTNSAKKKKKKMKKKMKKKERGKKSHRLHCSFHSVALRTDVQFVNFPQGSALPKGEARREEIQCIGAFWEVFLKGGGKHHKKGLPKRKKRHDTGETGLN